MAVIDKKEIEYTVSFYSKGKVVSRLALGPGITMTDNILSGVDNDTAEMLFIAGNFVLSEYKSVCGRRRNVRSNMEAFV